MRTFENTHPWISFNLDLRKASPKLWMLLGEAASKCEHIAGVPLRPSTAERLHLLYLAKGAAATTAIEGNTLTEEEVLQHLEGKLTLSPSKEYLTQEVDNIVAACNLITENLIKGTESLSPQRIREFNRQVLNGLALEEGIIPGDLRTYSVVVGNVYRGAPAEDCPVLLERLCDWLNGKHFEAPTGMEIVYALLKAITAHLYMAWIHPFGDGNGRTARLIEFLILLMAGVPQPACHLLSNHYNQTRAKYYKNLDYASKSGGEIMPFLEYAVQGFVEGLREQLEKIRNQQWDVSWRNYVYECFHDKDKAADRRRRRLVLDLGRQEAPVAIAKIPTLTTRLAQEYATKTYRTILRDITEVEKMGLVARSPDGVHARREVILAFLPWRKGKVT